MRIYSHGKTTQQILLTASATTIDIISNIGGTLGLLTGFSLLSGVELVHWIARYWNKRLSATFKVGSGNKKRPRGQTRADATNDAESAFVTRAELADALSEIRSAVPKPS